MLVNKRIERKLTKSKGFMLDKKGRRMESSKVKRFKHPRDRQSS